MKNSTEIVETFIQKYNIALKHKWSREQFATYMDMIPDSVRRKVGKIRTFIGLDLELLPLADKDVPLTPEKIKKFEDEYNEQLNKNTGIIKNGKRFVITSAQNATPVHGGFLGSILNYCEFNDAELLVIPNRYKNPTSPFTQAKQTNEWWSPLIEKYIVETEIHLTDNLFILGKFRIQPTAVDVLAGLESISGTSSTIVGHPKVQLKSVPSMTDSPKLLLSTGSITQPNYSKSKSGQVSEFHHSLAAVVVEIDDDGSTFHMRHIHANSKGGFYDLEKYYTPTEITTNHRAAALITGDTHVEFINASVKNATYNGENSIVATINPEVIVFHDLLDFYSRNHHHRGNDIIGTGKHRYGRNNIQKELQDVADFLDEVSRKNTKNVIVKSNHDEAFDRYLREADAKGDYENAEFYYYMKYHQMKNIRKTANGFSSIDPLQFWCLNPENGKGLKNTKNTVFLKRDESFKVKGVELSCHGDVGANGSRGDVKGFSKLSNKMVIGHSHTPAIYNGCYMVGLSANSDLEYKRGPSSWMHSHCIVYPDGKRTLVHIINGNWRA